MVNLKFGAFYFALCLLLTSCVCEATNETNPCKIENTTATCESNENFKSFQNATYITKLIVRSDALKRINKDDFAELANLEEIDLSDCGLEEIDENAFVGLEKLHKINLAGNTKLKIPSDASFITSNTLTCLNLSNTIIDELENTFANLPQLHNLDLSGTTIKDFSPLKNQANLSKLVVSKTNETKDLCNLLSLKEIIEKDTNNTETPLVCDTDKDKNTTNTEDTKPKILDNEASEPTVIANKTDSEAPQSSEVANNTEIEETKTDDLKTPTNDSEHTGHVESPPEDKNNTITGDESNKKNENPGDVTTEEPTTIMVKTETEKTEDEIVSSTVNPEHVEANTETGTEKPMRKMGNLQALTTEKPKVLSENSDEALLPSTANTSQSNGVNIVLGIILCVMIVGAIGFGYKYWKNRRSGYTHANTQDHDDDDKELQTIVAHRTDPDQN